MVVVTRATIAETLVLHLRSVLRQNVTDTNTSRDSDEEWIFKDEPEIVWDDANYPLVSVTDEDCGLKSRGFTANIIVTTPLIISISVYHDNGRYRDVIVSRIITALTNPTSADEDGVTIGENFLKFKSVSFSTDDFYTKYPKQIRVKTLTCEFGYSGG